MYIRSLSLYASNKLLSSKHFKRKTVLDDAGFARIKKMSHNPHKKGEKENEQELNEIQSY